VAVHVEHRWLRRELAVVMHLTGDGGFVAGERREDRVLVRAGEPV
jgi:hypothetical protein